MKWTCLPRLNVLGLGTLGLNIPRLSAVLLTALLLTGCISMPQSHLVTMAPGVPLQLTAPPAALQMQTKTQLIEAQFDGEIQSLLPWQ